MSKRSQSVKGDVSPATPTQVKTTGTEKLSGEIGKKYQLLVKILTSDPRYAKALADVTAPSQHDKLADALTGLSYNVGASLSIIKALISLEYERKQNQPFTILRVNSIVSKMMGKYTKNVGTAYLNTLLGDLIRELYSKPNMDLEVDKARLTGENLDQQVEENLVLLEQMLQAFVDRIIDPGMLELMPRELRAICHFMLDNGEIYKLDYDTNTRGLLSGFIMLRYICPAITVPNNWNIVPKMPEGNVRKNLTVIAKVLQKLANGETYDTENPHLMPLNKWIEINQVRYFAYLQQLPLDPLQQEGKAPFADLQRGTTFEDIHTKTFDMKDLSFIHSMIYEYGFDMIVSLQNEVIMTHDKRPVSIVSTETDFLSLVHDLGPPPDAAKQSVVAQKKQTLKGMSSDQIENTLKETSLSNLLKKIDMFDLTELESSRFLYVGKPTRTNTPTLYLVLHRIKTDFLEQTDKLAVFIHKTIQAVIANPFVFVVDLSWADLHDELQAMLYRTVASFTRLMNETQLKNCQQLIILHPTFKTQQGIQDIVNMIDTETRSKLIRTVYDWTDLVDAIEPMKIWIPTISKKFVPITYNLVKINNDGKKQERLMKITNESLLNIDPKAGTVQNEILFEKVQEVRARKGTNEILIKYEPETELEIANRGAGYFLKEATSIGIQTRTYNCFSDQQREFIIEAIYDAGIRSSSWNFVQVFHVQKHNKKNKLQKRLLKLTLDSILNFKDKVIKREIPYSVIQSFYVDTQNRSILYINFTEKGKKKSYMLECGKEADRIRDALLDAVKRFKFNIEVEKELFFKKTLSPAVSKFFAASETPVTSDGTEEADKWKVIVRIDTPILDMKRLFKKFNPTPDGRASLSIDNMLQVLQRCKLDMSEKEIEEIVDELDRDKKGYIEYDDLVKSWVFVQRTKSMIEKRKVAEKNQAAAKKNAAQNAAAKKK